MCRLSTTKITAMTVRARASHWFTVIRDSSDGLGSRSVITSSGGQSVATLCSLRRGRAAARDHRDLPPVAIDQVRGHDAGHQHHDDGAVDHGVVEDADVVADQDGVLGEARQLGLPMSEPAQ